MNIEIMFGAMAVVVLVLAVITVRLWWKVSRQQKEQALRAEEHQQHRARMEQERISYIYESLNVIARAVLDDQCPVTEGCIRMAVLLDNLSLDCETKNRFATVFKIYNATRHIPTHGSWKSLERKQRQVYKQEMWALEREHNDELRELMAFVKDNPFGTHLGNSVN